MGTSEDQALTDAWLARTDRALAEHKAVRDRHAPEAPIWITETAQAACGGSPWAATFTDTFRYLDQNEVDAQAQAKKKATGGGKK